MSPQRENTEVIDMVRRMFRALEKRVGDGDETDLQALAELRASLDEAIVGAVRGQRTQLERGVSDSNASWQHIANAFGTTRSAAFQRFGEKI